MCKFDFTIHIKCVTHSSDAFHNFVTRKAETLWLSVIELSGRRTKNEEKIH